MAPKQPPEPWHSFLNEIDSSLDEEVCLHCLGGFVIAQLYGLERHTVDVDTISISPRAQANSLLQLAGEGSSLHSKYKVYLQAVGICDPPEEYESRLREMFVGTYTHLRLLALDPYDLALAKLRRNSPRDREDVRRLASKVPFDTKVLKERFEKELAYLPNPYNRETTTLELWIEMIEEDRAST
jgi:hypothetical protein